MPSVDELNAMDEDDFVGALGHVYEDSPQLAADVWRRRPFADRDALGAAFVAVADELDDSAVLALLRAHPSLGDRGAMGDASRAEQRGAGLDGDGPIVERIRAGSERYESRFGFPFIIAVRDLQPIDVIVALGARLTHDDPTERAEALRQVQRIALLRLDGAVS